MALSKRPKGPEIEGYVADKITLGVGLEKRDHALDDSAHWNAVKRVKKLETDLALLMAHLKLEFRDIPSVPGKRVVGKATKKKANHGAAPVNVTAAQYMERALKDQVAGLYYGSVGAAQNAYPWGR